MFVDVLRLTVMSVAGPHLSKGHVLSNLLIYCETWHAVPGFICHCLGWNEEFSAFLKANEGTE
jgi:hypothetical protein